MDGITDREYVDGMEPYMVVAGECPGAPAGVGPVRVSRPRPRVAAPPRPPQALGSLGGPHAATLTPRGISRGHGYARPLPRAALTPPAVP